MMSFVADSALEAWAAAVRGISRLPESEVVHSTVSFPCDPACGPGHKQMSQMLTAAGELDVKQVANTIFPQSLYRPGAEEPAKALFENWNHARQVNKRRKGRSITYFDRMTHYPVETASSTNWNVSWRSSIQSWRQEDLIEGSTSWD